VTVGVLRSGEQTNMLSWKRPPVFTPLQRERAWVEIDLAALAHNVKQIRRLLAPQTDLMAVVKADAYGHGAVTVAQTVLQHGATWLGVATIPEGIELRAAGIEAPILLLGATHTPDEIQAIAQWKLQPTLCTPKQALTYGEVLAKLDYPLPLPVHLKLDTGMSRLGAPWQEAAEFVQWVRSLPTLQIASVYSHLATADSPDPTILRQQQARYNAAIQAIAQQDPSFAINSPQRPRFHLANSAATLSDRALHYDLVRVGLATYGLYPAPHLQTSLDLQPVMQVKARVTQVKTLQAGTGVSYGYQFIADREMRLAVVGIGYADGIPRNLSNKMTVLVRGQRIHQVGAVTMDQLMIDVTQIPDIQEGEVVTLLGKQGEEAIAAEDWADMLGTISWEILCGFKHRLPRIAVGQPLELSERQTL
jgi:alanine racemase